LDFGTVSVPVVARRSDSPSSLFGSPTRRSTDSGDGAEEPPLDSPPRRGTGVLDGSPLRPTLVRRHSRAAGLELDAPGFDGADGPAGPAAVSSRPRRTFPGWSPGDFGHGSRASPVQPHSRLGPAVSEAAGTLRLIRRRPSIAAGSEAEAPPDDGSAALTPVAQDVHTDAIGGAHLAQTPDGQDDFWDDIGDDEHAQLIPSGSRMGIPSGN
jgi:hypothetical protein